jgi:hypothetical protein
MSKKVNMKTSEFTEGPEALENFEKLATVILQSPKPEKERPKGAIRKTQKKSDKD